MCDKQNLRFCLSHIFSELFKNLVWHLSMLSLLTSLGRRGGGGGVVGRGGLCDLSLEIGMTHSLSRLVIL